MSGNANQKKKSTKHPYAAIEHRVIDSEAYKDLTFAARALLVMLARQLNGKNNGRLQAAHSYLDGYGFSKNTVTRAIAELIAHGLIYRSRSGGYHLGAAQYAVTWLPPSKNTDGLFFEGFKLAAWRDWQPPNKKSRSPNLGATNPKKGERTCHAITKFGITPFPKNEHIELMPYTPFNRPSFIPHLRMLTCQRFNPLVEWAS